jgi:hypothetical protein
MSENTQVLDALIRARDALDEAIAALRASQRPCAYAVTVKLINRDPQSWILPVRLAYFWSALRKTRISFPLLT